MAKRPYTSVPVRPETLERLRMYKTAGASFDDTLVALMDEVPVEGFIAQRLRKQARRTNVDWDALRSALADRR